jgi:CRISPR-associated endonuclease/helicase Cas3
MKSLKDVLAKSNPREKLTKHTDAVLKIWSELRERYSVIIDDKEFWKNSFYAILFHDFGKICDNFQETIKGERAFNDDERVRHEFFSGMFLFGNDHKYYLENPLPLIAIFSHHKAFNDEGFNKHINRNKYLSHKIEKELIEQFLGYTSEKSKEYGIEPPSVNEKFKFYITEDYQKLSTDYQLRFFNYLKKDDVLNQKKRKKYIFYKAVLNISDWTAQGICN